MKNYLLAVMLLLVMCSIPLIPHEGNKKEIIQADDLKLDELFTYQVEFKDVVTLGEPIQGLIKLTYQGNEPVFISAQSTILYKMQDGKFKEFDYDYDNECLGAAVQEGMAPPSPIKLEKGETYETGTLAYHKGNGHLYFEKEGKYEVRLEVYFTEMCFGMLGERKVYMGPILPRIRTRTYTVTLQEPEGLEAKVWAEITKNNLQPFLSPYDSLNIGCWLKEPEKIIALEKLIQTYPNAFLTDRLRLGYALSLIHRAKGDPLKNWEKANALIDSIKNKNEEYYRTLLSDFENLAFIDVVKTKVKEKVKAIYEELERNSAFNDFLNEWKTRKAQRQITLHSERQKHEEEKRWKKYEEERKAREKKQ